MEKATGVNAAGGSAFRALSLALLLACALLPATGVVMAVETAKAADADKSGAMPMNEEKGQDARTGQHEESAPAAMAGFRTLKLKDGSTLRYVLVLPDGFVPGGVYPMLLALPPGSQDEDMVSVARDLYWGNQAARRGWVVASPAAPEGRSFASGGEIVIPELLDALLKIATPEGGRFHLAGVSNGGRSAFRVAGLYPDRFQSLTVLPGFPSTDEDVSRLPRLAGMTIRMYAGGADRDWADATRRTKERLAALGIPSSMEIFEGEGHVPDSLTGEPIMVYLDSIRTKRTGPAGGGGSRSNP